MNQLVDFVEQFDFIARWPAMRQEVFGNSYHSYFLALVTFFAVWFGLLFVRRFAKSRLKTLASNRDSRYLALTHDLLREVRPYFFPVMALYLATRRLHLPALVGKYLSIFCLSVLVITVVKIASELLVVLITRNRTEESCDLATRNTNRNIVLLIKFGLWSAGALFILDNAGFNVATFIAGLGIGGVAIALASQAILGDTFSSFAISLDKPFEPGDYVVIDEFQGTIEQIGLKTTRIRSLSGELLVFSNSDLCKSRLRNYKKMLQRRIVTKIGVTYDTSYENLKKLPDLLRSIVESVPKTKVDRSHFATYGDFAIVFELVYFVQSPEMLDYMDAQQEINLKIHQEFSKAGISFAFPTQTVYVQSTTNSV